MVILPEFFFRESAVESGNSLVDDILVNSVVLDCLVIPMVFFDPDSLSDGEGSGVENAGDVGEHDPGSGVEVSDGEFSQQKIRADIPPSDFVDTPFPPEGMVSFSSKVLIDVLGNIVNFVLK